MGATCPSCERQALADLEQKLRGDVESGELQEVVEAFIARQKHGSDEEWEAKMREMGFRQVGP
jgi:hypothetical protein